MPSSSPVCFPPSFVQDCSLDHGSLKQRPGLQDEIHGSHGPANWVLQSFASDGPAVTRLQTFKGRGCSPSGCEKSAGELWKRSWPSSGELQREKRAQRAQGEIHQLPLSSQKRQDRCCAMSFLCLDGPASSHHPFECQRPVQISSFHDSGINDPIRARGWGAVLAVASSVAKELAVHFPQLGNPGLQIQQARAKADVLFLLGF